MGDINFSLSHLTRAKSALSTWSWQTRPTNMLAGTRCFLLYWGSTAHVYTLQALYATHTLRRNTGMGEYVYPIVLRGCNYLSKSHRMCSDVKMVLRGFQNHQWSAVITRSNITQYFIQHYVDWSRTKTRMSNHKLHPIYGSPLGCVFLRYGRKLTASLRHCTVHSVVTAIMQDQFQCKDRLLKFKIR